jgi:hypothetical protein
LPGRRPEGGLGRIDPGRPVELEAAARTDLLGELGVDPAEIEPAVTASEPLGVVPAPDRAGYARDGLAAERRAIRPGAAKASENPVRQVRAPQPIV